uniref:Uncharacterized protein n=1 Tax=Meloidogyne enterolobii TaxID=390850 RepID=A0A6V7WN52_MELEN|nr:unnamed protein product [Meloidogyne enterolobii]
MSILNNFIEKARGVWLQEASINILENLGPNNEVKDCFQLKLLNKKLSFWALNLLVYLIFNLGILM